MEKNIEANEQLKETDRFDKLLSINNKKIYIKN